MAFRNYLGGAAGQRGGAAVDSFSAKRRILLVGTSVVVGELSELGDGI